MLRIRDVYPGSRIPDPDPQHCIFSINSGTERRAGGEGGGVSNREQRSSSRSRRGGGGGGGGGVGLEKPNSGRDRGETFFPDSGSDRDSDETFQISRNLGLDLVEFVCLLDSQLWIRGTDKNKQLTIVKPTQNGINRNKYTFCVLK